MRRYSTFLKKVVDRNILDAVNSMGKKLKSELNQQFGQRPDVCDIRGHRFFLRLEIEEDSETKKPFPADRQINKKLTKAYFDAGQSANP